MNWRKGYWSLFLILLFIASYSREVVFLSINQYISKNLSFYGPTREFSFFQSLSHAELVLTKYFLTAGFSLLFMCVTLIGIRLVFRSNLLNRISYFIYGILAFVIAFLIIIAIISNSWETFYPLIRRLSGWIHNPLIFILISISQLSLINLRTNKNKRTFTS